MNHPGPFVTPRGEKSQSGWLIIRVNWMMKTMLRGQCPTGRREMDVGRTPRDVALERRHDDNCRFIASLVQHLPRKVIEEWAGQAERTRVTRASWERTRIPAKTASRR